MPNKKCFGVIIQNVYYSYFIDFAGVMWDTIKLGPAKANRQITNVAMFMITISGMFNSTGT